VKYARKEKIVVVIKKKITSKKDSLEDPKLREFLGKSGVRLKLYLGDKYYDITLPQDLYLYCPDASWITTSRFRIIKSPLKERGIRAWDDGGDDYYEVCYGPSYVLKQKNRALFRKLIRENRIIELITLILNTEWHN
jgi:hypothetical protein